MCISFVQKWWSSQILFPSNSIYQNGVRSARTHLTTLSQPNTTQPWHSSVGALYQKLYTGCNRGNGPDFGRVFLMLNYTEKPQNTYIQSWTVSEILAREKCGLLWCLRTVLCLLRYTRRIWEMGPFYFYCIPTLSLDTAERPWLCQHCIVVGSQWANMTLVRVFL